MNDRKFLNYVYLHSQTDRALFSAEDCQRLFKLANHPFPEPNIPSTAFRSMEFYDIKHLIEKAQKLIK